jgi:hypothetical protein
MLKNKNIEKEFKKYNIEFERFEDGYFLWGFRDEKVDIRTCWSIVSDYRNQNTPVNKNVKHFSNEKERAALRENLEKERYERAEARESKESRLSWD